MNTEHVRRLDVIKARLENELPGWLMAWEGDDCYGLFQKSEGIRILVQFWLRHEGDEDKALALAKRIEAALA